MEKKIIKKASYFKIDQEILLEWRRLCRERSFSYTRRLENLMREDIKYFKRYERMWNK